MQNRIKQKNGKQVIFIFCFYLLFPFLFLESSLINPDLVAKLLGNTNFATGYDDFAKGRTYFNEENWEKAIQFFTQAVEKSHKPNFVCSNYIGDDGYGEVCNDYSEDVKGYSISEVEYEFKIAIYRHSHFYLGLIHLHQGEILKANLHFKEAIGFMGNEDGLSLNFYKCANILNPSWIVLASFTRLQIGKVEEAKALIDMTSWTIRNFEFLLTHRWLVHWTSNQSEWYEKGKYNFWNDLIERGITDKKTDMTDRKWEYIQIIILCNMSSIIASAQSDLKKAIDEASCAIHIQNLAINDQLFPEKSKDHFVLYHNRGILYLQEGLYQEALADFNKAIELNSIDAEIYFQRGNVYLILEE